MSFIDLMASHVWSEADIVRRTESMIASEFNSDAVSILNRKVTGAAMGQYQLSPAEQADVMRYAVVSEAARLAGVSARADMKLLAEVLAAEPAYLRLRREPVAVELDADGVLLNQEAVELDAAEREEASAVMGALSPAALALVELRNPAPAVVESEIETQG